MRLVRGSILSSEACSTSNAARLLRLFICSQEGTDVSVKSFLNSAARSLESMGEGPLSSLKKHRKKKRRSELETTTDFENPNEGLSASGHGEQEKAGYDSHTAPTVQKNSEKVPTTNGVFTDAVVASTLGSLNQCSTEISGETERKKRKKDRKHQHNEDHDGGIRNLQGETDLELKEAPATHAKKSKKLKFPDHLVEANANNNLVFSSSRKAEQEKHFVNEGDYGHSRNVAEIADEEQQRSHSTKKKKKDKTPKSIPRENATTYKLSQEQ